jgi:hypothetical protein
MKITVRQLKQLIREEVSLYEQAQDAKVDQLASFFEENPEIGEAVANLNPRKLQKLVNVSEDIAEELPHGGITESIMATRAMMNNSRRIGDLDALRGEHERQIQASGGKPNPNDFITPAIDGAIDLALRPEINIGILAGLLGFGAAASGPLTPLLASMAGMAAGVGTAGLIAALRRAGFKVPGS